MKLKNIDFRVQGHFKKQWAQQRISAQWAYINLSVEAFSRTATSF